MKVDLIRYTIDPAGIAGEAAALCYNGKNPEKSLAVALDGGHESIIEHAVFTFVIEGVSRVTLAQLTRHRLASFSVSSQRYIKIIDVDFVTPQTIIDHAWQDNYKDEIMRNLTLYTLMVNDGVPYEDARYVLPQAFTCNVMLTMNARELRHFFSLRCCARAQWEIRHLARQMLALCQEVAPVLFADAGPGCVRGHCPEGAKGCGKGKANGTEKSAGN